MIKVFLIGSLVYFFYKLTTKKVMPPQEDFRDDGEFIDYEEID